jgi:sialate O-acetylesterase
MNVKYKGNLITLKKYFIKRSSNMNRFFTLILGMTILSGCITMKPDKPTAKDVTVSNLISSNMVLQRNTDTRIWGTAVSGGAVFIKINGQNKWAKADSDGNWEVTLEPMSAGGPFELLIEGKNTIKMTNVMVGDVWVCSGQSNMQWTVANSNNAKKEIANASHPNIRLFSVPRTVKATPQTELKGTWLACSPKTIPSFSAVGYFFGKKLHKDLKVPIGLIHTSWGGTPAEAWTTIDSLKDNVEFKPIVDRFNVAMKNYPKKLALHKKQVKEWKANLKKDNNKTRHDDPGNTGFAKEYAKTDFNDKKWKSMNTPDTWERIMNIDGVVWFRKEITIPKAWAGKDLELNLYAVDDFDTTYFNNKKVGGIGKENLDSWRTAREYKIPAELVKPGKAVISVRIFDHYGGGGFNTSVGEMKIAPKDQKGIDLSGKWKYFIAKEMSPSALFSTQGPRTPMGPNNPHSPAGLYNAMIHPLIKYPVKGAIWYQGETNAGRAYQYRNLLKTMITDWRTVWKQDDMPFFVVQLANFMTPATKPEESAWAELREAQNMVLELPNTGLALAIDIGEAKNIHPKNKQEVGKRLALSAEKIAYKQDIVHSGPSYNTMKIEGSKIRINFKNIGTGLIAKGGNLKHFAIARKDKKFVWADAVIDGNSIIVSSAKIKDPVAVRYAWANNPKGCNLYNNEGLPGVPFRTDDWKGVTAGKR